MLIALLTFLIASSAWSSNEAAPALSVQVSYGEDLNANTSKSLIQLTELAMTIVRMFRPAGYENNLFRWTGDREILRGKKMYLFFATTQRPIIQPLLQNSGSKDLDAFTMVPVDQKTKNMKIMVVLLVDKLLYDSDGKNRPDRLSRLIVALAHEIYGNVQHFLNFEIGSAQAQTRADRVQQELGAFRASLAFLTGLSQNPMYDTMPEHLRYDLNMRLPFEVRGYRSWLRANPTEAPDPACEAMLKSIRTSH